MWLVVLAPFSKVEKNLCGLTYFMKVKVKVTQSCLTLRDPMDYTGHGILQARILEWVAFPFSRWSSQPRDWTQVSHTAGRFSANWAMREANLLYKYRLMHTEAQSFLWFPYNHFTLTYGVIPPALLNLWWCIIQSVPHLLLCFKPTKMTWSSQQSGWPSAREANFYYSLLIHNKALTLSLRLLHHFYS